MKIKVERLGIERAQKYSRDGIQLPRSNAREPAESESINPKIIKGDRDRRSELSELEQHRWSWKLRETALAGAEQRLISRRLKLTLFPYLSHLRFMDHYMRVLFPFVYLVCILYFLALVEYGDIAYSQLEKQACYTNRDN